jgi:hypothetical protein
LNRIATHLELDGARPILIENIKHIIGELRRIAKGEELFVDLDKLLLVQLTGWAIFDEPFVPLLKFLLVDCTYNGIKLRNV